MSIIRQKYAIITSIYLLNILLSFLLVYYSSYWFVFLPLLAYAPLISSINVLYILYKKLTTKTNPLYTYRNEPTEYAFVIPTYNESKEELYNSLDSLTKQISSIPSNLKRDTNIMIIVCDGKVKGKGNNKSTDKILIEDILHKNITNKITYRNAYVTWENKNNSIDLYSGVYNDTPYILIVKENNYGKRDSLVLVRRLLYQFNLNMKFHPIIDISFLSEVRKILMSVFHDENIKYLIGTDADTVFEINCVDELIKEISKNKNTVGCVGFINISPLCSKISPFTLYQNAEYMYAQCLKRQQQSLMTHKVNCLSGCVQILKICKETCGDTILNKFNYKPDETDNILKHIRSYASEDRNHVCLMMSEYSYVNTTQTLHANAYTLVPMSFEIFFSQRRRWNLGTITNDILLLTSPNILFYERLSAFANILTFTIAPFILVSTAVFIKTIIKNPSMLMLYLSVVIFIPLSYALIIPIFIKPMTFRDALYYWFSYVFYLSVNTIMNILTNLYAIFNMEKLKWGKTRQIEITNNEKKNSISIDENSFSTISSMSNISNMSKITQNTQEFFDDKIEDMYIGKNNNSNKLNNLNNDENVNMYLYTRETDV
jgi:chitin synthase